MPNRPLPLGHPAAASPILHGFLPYRKAALPLAGLRRGGGGCLVLLQPRWHNWGMPGFISAACLGFKAGFPGLLISAPGVVRLWTPLVN